MGPFIILFSMIIGLFYESFHVFGYALKHLTNIQNLLFLWIIIPSLCFRWAFFSNVNEIWRSFGQIILLGGAFIMITTLFQSITILYILDYKSIFTWEMALFLTALIGAVDSGPAVGALKSGNAKTRLLALIEGESLFKNMFSGMLFYIFLESVTNVNYNAGTIVLKILTNVLGAVVIPIFISNIFTKLMKCFSDSYMITAFTFIVQFLSFFVGETSMAGIGAPGLLSVIASGLYLGTFLRPNLSPKTLDVINSTWGSLEYILGTVVYLYLGGYLGIFIRENVINVNNGFLDWHDVGLVCAFTIMVLPIRILSLAILWPFLNILGNKITLKEFIILSFSGFRGGVMVAISLVVTTNPTFDKKYRILFFLMSLFPLLFTQTVHTLTMKYLMKCLGYNQFQKIESKISQNTKKKFYLNILKKTKKVQKDKLILNNVCWKSIYKIFDFENKISNLNSIKLKDEELYLNYSNKTTHHVEEEQDNEYLFLNKFKDITVIDNTINGSTKINNNEDYNSISSMRSNLN